MKIKFIVFVTLFYLTNLSSQKINIEYQPDDYLIKIKNPTKEQLETFNSMIEGDSVSVQKNDIEISGNKTENKKFFDEIILPILMHYRQKLLEMKKEDAINEIIIFTHRIFKLYLGKDFYRWGGDIFDLDDPQNAGVRYKYRYGLDCSGFVGAVYQIAEYLHVIDGSSAEAVFSSEGFKNYCIKSNTIDKGGRDGTTNNFRLDTSDLIDLGKVIFEVVKGTEPTDEQIALLKPGDIVIKNGHVGIIVMINGEPYYLESGGWVVPKNDGLPCKVKDAMKIFGKRGNLTVRRALEF